MTVDAADAHIKSKSVGFASKISSFILEKEGKK